MPVISQVIGKVSDLRIEWGMRRKRFFIQLDRLLPVFQETRPDFPGEIQSVVTGILDLQFVDDAECLPVVIKTAVGLHDLMEFFSSC